MISRFNFRSFLALALSWFRKAAWDKVAGVGSLDEEKSASLVSALAICHARQEEGQHGVVISRACREPSDQPTSVSAPLPAARTAYPIVVVRADLTPAMLDETRPGGTLSLGRGESAQDHHAGLAAAARTRHGWRRERRVIGHDATVPPRSDNPNLMLRRAARVGAHSEALRHNRKADAREGRRTTPRGRTVKRRTKVASGGALVAGLALGGGATAYGAYYQERALPGSSISGVDVSGMTRAQVAAALQERADQVAVAVTTPTGTQNISLADLGAGIDIDATLARTFAPNQDWSSYAKALIEQRAVSAVPAADEAALAKLVASLSAASEEPARDASVRLASDKKSFTVGPAKAGQSLDTTALSEAAATAARTLTSSQVTLAPVAKPATVTTEQAEQVAAQANDIVKAAAKISAGTKTFAATTEQKASWVDIPQATGELGTPTVDASAVTAWVTEAASSLKVAPRAGMRYLDQSGKLLRVVTPAADGAEVSNASAVAKALAASLSSGRSKTAEFQTKAVAATWNERRIARGAERLAYPAVDGEKWVDVNLASHTMTAYVGGQVVLGPIKMVNGAPATPTDIGTFHIYWKNPMMTMRGQNADGTDYETPNVPWSSFFNGGEALHGAYWRETWGYAASHGCVNLPIPTAKWIYDWAPIGTPVVTHN